MSDEKDFDEMSLEELEKERHSSLGAIGGVFGILLLLGVVLGVAGVCIELQASEEEKMKLGGGLIAAAGLIFVISLVLIFHFALRWEKLRTLMSVVMVAVILGGTGATINYLVKNKPEAEKEEERALTAPVVEVVASRAFEGGVEIEAEGIVESQKTVALTAEVSGKAVEVADSLVPGGKVREGQVLLRMEPADYRAALEQAKAAQERAELTVTDALLALDQEKARRDQALRDWKKLGTGEPSDLLSRKPQLASAEARVSSTQADVLSAQAEVDRAARNLERTVIRAPFDAVVRQEAVEVGAVLAPGTQLATLFSERSLEVELPLRLADYALLRRDENGAVVGEVELSGTLGNREVIWPGRIVRTTGEVSRGALTAGVVVAVDAAEGEGELSLPPAGLFVEASLQGQELAGAVVIPREAVREGDRVAVFSADETLEMRDLKVARTSATEVLATKGVEVGELVILTRLSNPVPGMALSVRDDEDLSEDEDDSEPETEVGEDE